MKKIVSVIMVICLAVTCLMGCGSEKKETKDTEVKNEVKTEEKQEAKKGVKVIDVNLTEEEYAFGVDKTQPELLEKVNTFLGEIRANGEFDKICNRYFGDGEPVPVTSYEFDSSKDQLVVATNAAFPPFEYTSGDKYLGVDMEIAAALAEYLGQELVISNMDFDAVCLSVGQQKCDIAMAGLTVRADREEYVTFSDSYYNASQKLICLNSCKDFDDCKVAADVEKILNGCDSSVTIGVQDGTTGKLYVEGDEDWGFPGYKVTCKGYKNGTLAVQDLLNGGINYVIIDSAPAARITESINAMQ